MISGLQEVELAKGGFRVGAGRRTGTSDKEMRKVNVEKVLQSIGSGPDKTPLAYMLGIMQSDRTDIKMSERIQCAIAAAPYVHPRLSSVEVKGDANAPLQIQSDIGQALAKLAEIARSRVESVDYIEAGAYHDEETSGA